MGLCKLLDSLGIRSSKGVDESLLLHVDHIPSVTKQVGREVVLKDEQLLFESVLGLHSVLVLDGFLPHSHELPFLEFLEEVEFLDVVVGVSLDQPLA